MAYRPEWNRQPSSPPQLSSPDGAWLLLLGALLGAEELLGADGGGELGVGVTVRVLVLAGGVGCAGDVLGWFGGTGTTSVVTPVDRLVVGAAAPSR